MTANKAPTQDSLTKEQKQAVGLLSIGTFLEYFDLMLFVHMAILLNELFFPKYDPFVNSLLTAFAFCSTYLMRPVGAFIFGYIGDTIGRKQTVIITTFMMSLSSFCMFLLPTYAQIGITATWLVTICRMLQGMSSMGEIIGAVIYLSELIPAPASYRPVGFIRMLTGIATLFALGVATISIQFGLNWRYAFLFGTVIGLIGVVARTALRETPEFVDARKRISSRKQKIKITRRILISYLFMECTWPLWVYVTYIHFGMVLKNELGYSAADVIEHNLYVTVVCIVSSGLVVFLSKRLHPFWIMTKVILLFCLSYIFLLAYIGNDITIMNVTLMQCLMMFFHPTTVPADPIIIKHFPVLRRFFTTSILYSISRLLVYIITSFGTVYLTEYFGTYGLLFLIIPVVTGYLYGLNTFIELEREVGNYPKKTFWSIVSANKPTSRD